MMMMMMMMMLGRMATIQSLLIGSYGLLSQVKGVITSAVAPLRSKELFSFLLVDCADLTLIGVIFCGRQLTSW